jgi:hypothetical protein
MLISVTVACQVREASRMQTCIELDKDLGMRVGVCGDAVGKGLRL